MAKWTREYERQREKILESLQRAARPFGDVSDAAQGRRRALPFLEWCVTYLPHYFDRPFAPFHRRMAEAAGEPGMLTFIGAFRGAGKSVLLALARPLYRALRGEVPYFIYGACVQKLAAQAMDGLRLELEHNERIASDYGDLRVDGSEEVWDLEQPRRRRDNGTFAHAATRFEAFGIGMSPRGRRFRQHRPHEFVGDDLETAELARNPQREQQLWDWMYDEVLPALEPDVHAFTVVGTMFGPACMMERAREHAKRMDPAGRPLARLFIQAAMEDGRSVWPERFSDAALARIRAQMGLRNWNRNYALVAHDPTKPFQPEWMATYDESKLDLSGLDIVAFLDPAISERETACPRALVCVAADRLAGTRYVLDAWIKRGTPREMVDQLFGVFARFKPRVIGIEINGGYALIRPLVESEMPKKGWLPLRYISHTQAKEVRIERLSPGMEAGRWRFPKDPSPGVRMLQDQFLSYPDGFVDGPDACAGCDELLPDTFAPAASGFGYRGLEKRTSFAEVA